MPQESWRVKWKPCASTSTSTSPLNGIGRRAGVAGTLVLPRRAGDARRGGAGLRPARRGRGRHLPGQGHRSSPQAMLLLASDCDWSVVIAPELDGILSEWVEYLCENDCPVLAPSNDAVALTSDKLQLADHWREHGVPTPATTDREPTGARRSRSCGSRATGPARPTRSSFNPHSSWRGRGRERQAEMHTGPMILQEFVGGHRGERRVSVRPGRERTARAGLSVVEPRRPLQVPRWRAADPAGARRAGGRTRAARGGLRAGAARLCRRRSGARERCGWRLARSRSTRG